MKYVTRILLAIVILGLALAIYSFLTLVAGTYESRISLPPFRPSALICCFLSVVISGIGTIILTGIYLARLIRKNRKQSAEQGGPGYPPQGVGSPDP